MSGWVAVGPLGGLLVSVGEAEDRRFTAGGPVTLRAGTLSFFGPTSADLELAADRSSFAESSNPTTSRLRQLGHTRGGLFDHGNVGCSRSLSLQRAVPPSQIGGDSPVLHFSSLLQTQK
jgi:hypothetical protein